MNALWYRLRKTVKNTLLDLVHHPVKLILYLFVAAMLLFSMLSMALMPDLDDMAPELAVKADMRYLEGLYVGILALVLIPILLVGLHSGARIFTLSDVNLMFVSPLRPKQILLFGLLRQMGTALLVMVCFSAYGSMAVDAFGIPLWFAVLLLLGLAITIMLAQLLTMLLYCFSNGNRRRIRGAKMVLYAIVLLIVGAVAIRLYRAGFSMEALAAAAGDPLWEALPFIGWLKGLLFALYAGAWGQVALFGGLFVLGVLAAVWLLVRSPADYYEDVLQNAETTYAAKQAIKEGRLGMDTNSFAGKARLKQGDTGLKRGFGASAFFFKHLREIRRRQRGLFIGRSTLFVTGIGLFMSLLMTRTGDDPVSSGIAMMSAVMMGVYLQFFTSASGEWEQELSKPFLYLAPCPPFQKLLWASMTSLIKPLIDGIIAFTVIGVAIGAKPLTVGICILLYASFGALFTTTNVLSQRLLGQLANKGLILFLYVLMILILVLPGLVVGLVLGFCVEGMPRALMGLPVVVWNLIVSAGIYGLFRNILHDMETM